MKICALRGEEFKPFLKHQDGHLVYVSNFGKVVDSRNGEVKKLFNNGNGYIFFLQGYTKDKNRSIREYVHRAVAMLFLDNPNQHPQVNHKNLDKSDNSVHNLEWVGRSENILHAHRTGAMKKRTENGKINILTESQVIDLYTSVKSGIGISEKARQMGIPRTTASSIMNKRSRSDITDKLDESYGWT